MAAPPPSPPRPSAAFALSVAADVPLGLDLDLVRPVVARVWPASPLRVRVAAGDAVTAVDGRRAAGMSHGTLNRLLNNPRGATGAGGRRRTVAFAPGRRGRRAGARGDGRRGLEGGDGILGAHEGKGLVDAHRENRDESARRSHCVGGHRRKNGANKAQDDAISTAASHNVEGVPRQRIRNVTAIVSPERGTGGGVAARANDVHAADDRQSSGDTAVVSPGATDVACGGGSRDTGDATSSWNCAHESDCERGGGGGESDVRGHIVGADMAFGSVCATIAFDAASLGTNASVALSSSSEPITEHSVQPLGQSKPVPRSVGDGDGDGCTADVLDSHANDNASNNKATGDAVTLRAESLPSATLSLRTSFSVISVSDPSVAAPTMSSSRADADSAADRSRASSSDRGVAARDIGASLASGAAPDESTSTEEGTAFFTSRSVATTGQGSFRTGVQSEPSNGVGDSSSQIDREAVWRGGKVLPMIRTAPEGHVSTEEGRALATPWSSSTMDHTSSLARFPSKPSSGIGGGVQRNHKDHDEDQARRSAQSRDDGIREQCFVREQDASLDSRPTSEQTPPPTTNAYLSLPCSPTIDRVLVRSTQSAAARRQPPTPPERTDGDGARGSARRQRPRPAVDQVLVGTDDGSSGEVSTLFGGRWTPALRDAPVPADGGGRGGGVRSAPDARSPPHPPEPRATEPGPWRRDARARELGRERREKVGKEELRARRWNEDRRVVIALVLLLAVMCAALVVVVVIALRDRG